MKKVTGCIDVRALGCYNWEFYVDDDTTDEEIKEQVETVCDYYINNKKPVIVRKEVDFNVRTVY